MVRDVPLDVFIHWPIPNYTDPVTQGYGALIVNVIFMAITIPLVGLRIYSRWYMRRWLGWDDFFCVLSVFFAVALSIVTIIANYVYGCDRHIYDVPPQWFVTDLKIIMSTKALFTCAGTFIRQSLLCLYLRLVHDSGMKGFRWAIHSATFINAAIGIAFLCLTIFQCSPVKAYWAWPPDPSAKCLDEGITTLVCGILVTIVDFAILMLPIPIILRLQMSLREKLGVIALLNLGLIAVILAIVRTWYIWKATIASYDETWYAYPLWIVAVIETDLAIMCSCAPAIRPFVVQHMPWLIKPFRLLGTAFSSSHRSSQGPSSRRTSRSGPSHRYNDTHKAYMNEATAVVSSSSGEASGEASPVIKEKTAYDHAPVMEYGRADDLAEKEVTTADGKRSRGKNSFALSEAPTLRPTTAPQSTSSRLKDMFSYPFSRKARSRSRSRSMSRSKSQNRQYMERQLWSYDDSNEDIRLAMDRAQQKRRRFSRRQEPDSPTPPARSRARSASPTEMRIYKHQSYELESAPAMSPEEIAALQYSIAGLDIEATHASAAPTHRRQTSGFAPLYQPRRTSRHIEEELERQMAARDTASPDGHLSIWDIKRREFFENGGRWAEEEEQERQMAAAAPRQPPSSSEHIVSQLSRRNSRAIDHSPALHYNEPLDDDYDDHHIAHIADAYQPPSTTASPEHLLRKPSAAARAMQNQTPRDHSESSIGSFLDDASEDSGEGSPDRSARGRRRQRRA